MTRPLSSHHWSAILPAAPAVYDWQAIDFLQMLKQVVLEAGLTTVGELAFTFQPQGISAVVLLEESHVAIHFWPEKGKVTVDVHVCDFQTSNQQKAKTLTQLLSACISENQPTHWQYLAMEE